MLRETSSKTKLLGFERIENDEFQRLSRSLPVKDKKLPDNHGPPCACVRNVRKGGGWGEFKSSACPQNALVVDSLIKPNLSARRLHYAQSGACGHIPRASVCPMGSEHGLNEGIVGVRCVSDARTATG